jgi:hypothetical protein
VALIFFSPSDLESAFEKVETLFLAMVNVQRRPASGRDDPFYG